MTIEIPTLEPNPVWSATPTPFTEDMEIDRQSVRRLVTHHVGLGVTGLLVAGTTGEGPWMTNRLRRDLVRAVADYAENRLVVAVQVTDNSAARILDNIEIAKQDGADIAVISAPFFTLPATADRLLDLYATVIRNSPLPVGIYDLGRNASTFVPSEVIAAVCREEKVILLKDSSNDPSRRDLALSVRRERPDLRLLNGYEFDCVGYLQAGYDGLLLGGGIFNGYIARQLMRAVFAGEIERANKLQERMNTMMWDTYGGKELACWLRGEKYLMVKMGVFNTDNLFLDYSLTAECQRNIDRLIEENQDVLFPQEAAGDV